MNWKKWLKKNLTISRVIDLIIWHGILGFALYLFYFVVSYNVTWQIPVGLIAGYLIGLYKIFYEEESQTKKFLVELKRVD